MTVVKFIDLGNSLLTTDLRLKLEYLYVYRLWYNKLKQGLSYYMITLTKDKKYRDREAVRERILNETLRKKAENAAGQLSDILVKEFAVERVVLFGSVLRKSDMVG